MINFDMEILLLIQEYLRNPFLDRIMIFITELGDKGVIWIGISFALLFSKKYRTIGILMLITLIIQATLGEVVLKNIFCRNRPFTEIEGIKLLVEGPTSYSFPSGHTSSSFAIATIAWIYTKKIRIPILILACLIAFSRLYLFVHYPTDIIGGILLGIGTALAVSYVYKAKFEKLKIDM